MTTTSPLYPCKRHHAVASPKPSQHPCNNHRHLYHHRTQPIHKIYVVSTVSAYLASGPTSGVCVRVHIHHVISVRSVRYNPMAVHSRVRHSIIQNQKKKKNNWKEPNPAPSPPRRTVPRAAFSSLASDPRQAPSSR
ncbi:hypothetical protein M6B38_294450 [Iris pallida]|uniref:Uncharacterized protein n=1 Tax=Iris pallida TaxID=29817 RepID=A0AAX6HTA3_IRIPA|nr:hypothetical protein M6B38_294450 [Iris pallida]